MVCDYKGKYIPVELEVVQQDVPSVLGLKTSTEMKLVKRIDSINNKAKNMLEEYQDVFTGLGCITDVFITSKLTETTNQLFTYPEESH